LTGVAAAVEPARQNPRATWPAAAAASPRRFAYRGRDDWAVAAADRDCCLTPVLDFAEAAAHPHLLANRWFARPDGAFAAPQPVIRFDAGAGQPADSC
jgi:alpha-methylacyl-CoA racemase